MRRLITLISAGRNRIVMIRRELARTENASWARPYRTKHGRILRSVRLDSVTCTGGRMSLTNISYSVRCRPTGGGTQEQPGKTKPAIFSCKGKVFRASPPGPVQAERSESEGSKSLDGWRRCATKQEEEMAGIVKRPFDRV